MKKEAHAKVAMMRKMEPLTQSLPVAPVVLVTKDRRGWMCFDQTISMIGPLYSVINMAPDTVTIVPITFAWHLTSFMFIFSILDLHSTK